MKLQSLYRGVVRRTARPDMVFASEAQIWQLTLRELADLPLGPEPLFGAGRLPARQDHR